MTDGLTIERHLNSHEILTGLGTRMIKAKLHACEPRLANNSVRYRSQRKGGRNLGRIRDTLSAYTPRQPNKDKPLDSA